MSNRRYSNEQPSAFLDNIEKTSKTGTKLANPFKNQRGLPPFIPRSSIEKLEFNIDCASGEPKPSHFKISQGMLISDLPQYFHPPLEYGDHVVAVNGEDIRDKLHFVSLLQECQRSNTSHTITFLVERLKSTTQIDITTMQRDYGNFSDNLSLNPPTRDKITGKLWYEYFKGTLVFFPRAAVGISVKAVNRKVYIDSTDNGFNSIGRRIFFIGDCVIAVNNIPCYTVSDAGDQLLKALKRNCIATVILERAIDPLAVQIVRTALTFGKSPQIDPKMQDDVVLLCKEEIRKMHDRKLNHDLMPIAILKDKKKGRRKQEELKSSARTQLSASIMVRPGERHVEFSATSKEMTIGMDLWNPSLLMKVPGLSHNQAVNGVLPQRRKPRVVSPSATSPPSSGSMETVKKY